MEKDNRNFDYTTSLLRVRLREVGDGLRIDIKGYSMSPSLISGDKVLVWATNKTFKVGDIVFQKVIHL